MVEARTCERCGTPVNGFILLCQQCFDDEAAYDDTGCANCGGEGFTYGCGWDWQCETYDEGEGTCLCTRQCDWCSPPKLSPEDQAARQLLGEMLRGEELWRER